MQDSHLFTSESVSEGHPDKVADRIADSVLDAYLAQDPTAKVACETLVTRNLIVIAGETHSSATVDVEAVARKAIQEIGYTDESSGFSHLSPIVRVRIFVARHMVSDFGFRTSFLDCCSRLKQAYVAPFPSFARLSWESRTNGEEER